VSDATSRFPTLALALASALLASAATACFSGKPIASGTTTRNGATLSVVTARPQAGGDHEGPLGFTAAVSRSALYDELASKGIRVESLGPLGEIRDRSVLLAVMGTFARALGVRCAWCHVENDFAAPTARKADAAYMWNTFVAKLELADGGPLYCDSCHHESTIFLHRNDRHAVAKYMESEYVGQLRRRDGRAHGCGTCHGAPFNSRFLPRIDNPRGYHPPVAEPGMQP
jgi:hypothetical protein